MGEKIIPHRPHHAAALHRPERRQRAAYVAGAGGGHRPVHVARIGEGLFGQGFAGCGIIDDEPARAAIDEVSIDEVLPVAGNLLSHGGLPHPVLQGHHRMLGIQPAFRIDDQRTGLVAAALQAALHRFDETNVFFHGGGAVLDGEPAHDVGIDAIDRVPAAPDHHVIGIHRAPVIGVEHVARIDLKREHRPQEPGGVVARMGIALKVDRVAHPVEIGALGGVTQAMPLWLDVVGLRLDHARWRRSDG
jgi:hypothetical protein